MANTKPSWTHEEMTEIIAKAEGMFGTLIGLTTTPREAAEIIALMHLLLFMNHGDGKATVDDMLADYCSNFKANFAEQSEAHKRVVN